MIKLEVGAPGSGKTKLMIQSANESAQTTKGEIVFIDIADKHSNMLDRKIRFVATSELNIDRFSSLYGLLCGIVSANHDIDKIFVDGLNKIVTDNFEENVIEFLELIKKFSDANNFEVIFSASSENEELIKKLDSFN